VHLIFYCELIIWNIPKMDKVTADSPVTYTLSIEEDSSHMFLELFEQKTALGGVSAGFSVRSIIY
jgi:hypothetical protein